MRLLKRFFLTLLVLIAILLGVGLLLPDKAHVERSIKIQVPPATVYPLLTDFREFNRWSPWSARDPATRYEFAGPPSGRGARMSWQSDHPEVGSGSQEIVAAEPDRLVKTLLDFGAQGTAFATFELAPVDGGSRVTWSLDSEFGYDLIGRYFGLMFDRWVGPDYEQGLANLKRLAEEASSEAPKSEP